MGEADQACRLHTATIVAFFNSNILHSYTAANPHASVVDPSLPFRCYPDAPCDQH
jgi:hypothetical protein